MNKVKKLLLNILLVDLILIVLLAGYIGISSKLNDNPIPLSYGSIIDDNNLFAEIPQIFTSQASNTQVAIDAIVEEVYEPKYTFNKRKLSDSSSSSSNNQNKPTKPSNPGKTSQRVKDRLKDEDKVRVIVNLDNVELKGNVLAQLKNFDKKSDWSDGFAGYVDISDLEILELLSDVVTIEEDLPLQTMTYEGYDLIDLEKVLANDILTLDNANTPTTKLLSVSGTYNLTGAGQTVAMIDSGLTDSHQEFNGKVIAQWDFCSNDYTCAGEDSEADDRWNHGTKMAGVIAAKGVNMDGMAPDADIVALKITNASGGAWASNLINALDWLISNASLYNISTVYIGVGSNLYEGSELFCNLITGAPGKIDTLTSMNITVVAPSGHDGNISMIAYPACIANTISVGAVTEGKAYAPDQWNLTGVGGVQSNRRNGLLDLLAPGGVGGTKTTDRSNYVGGTSVGTSVSAAYVTGASMLLREYWDNNAWDFRPAGLVNGNIPNTIEYIFKMSGVQIEDENNPGVYYPRLDMFGAINYEENKPVVTLETANESVVAPGVVVLEYNVTDQHDIDTCSLYIDGVENQTHYYEGSKNSEDSCNEQWGFDCNEAFTGADNTFDSCDAGFSTTNYGGVNEVEINDLYVLDGQSLNVTCRFELDSRLPVDGAIFYYNGLNWTEIWHENLPVMTGNYPVTATINANGNLGKQWIRCSYLYYTENISNQCAEEPSPLYFHDNDDVYFYLTDDSEQAKEYEMGRNNFSVDLGESTYDWRVECEDTATVPNTGVSAENVITVTVIDITPPVISNVSEAVFNDSATITWNTDEGANNSQANYGLTTALGTVIGDIDQSLRTNHAIGLINLIPNTTYFYNVTSCDAVGNCATDGIYSFITLPNVVVNQPPVISGIPDNETDEDVAPPLDWVDLWSYVSDPDNATAELTFAVGSNSNPLLIDCFVVSNRYVRCSTPAANQSGFSDINVSVYDGEYYDYDTFRVTVNPVDDPAVWDILSNQEIDENSLDGTVVYANLGNQCSDIDSLVSIIPSASIHYILGFSGNNLIINSLEADWFGTETVNLDCNGIAASFDLTVNDVAETTCYQVCTYGQCYDICV